MAQTDSVREVCDWYRAAAISRSWRAITARPFRPIVDELPIERRERIEAHTKALITEYELLKALRQELRVSQEQHAELMGIRQASVSKIENQDDMRISTRAPHLTDQPGWRARDR